MPQVRETGTKPLTAPSPEPGRSAPAATGGSSSVVVDDLGSIRGPHVRERVLFGEAPVVIELLNDALRGSPGFVLVAGGVGGLVSLIEAARGGGRRGRMARSRTGRLSAVRRTRTAR